MNIVGRFFGFGTSLTDDSNASEVVKIPSGQLFYVQPDTIRSSRECIYNDAMATVRRTAKFEHTYQLVITRVYDEGEEEIIEEEDENDDKVFLISEELEFRVGTDDDGPTLIWRDFNGDVDETFEFVAAGTNKHTIDFFAQCMYKAMYERKYKVSSDDVLEKELNEFVWSGPGKKMKAKSLAAPPIDTRSNLARGGQGLSPTTDSGLTEIVSKPAALLFWDAALNRYEKDADVLVKIVKHPSKYDFWISAVTVDGERRALFHELKSELNARWLSKFESVTWNYHPSAWCLVFENAEDFLEFQDAFSKHLYENLNQIPWQKAKPSDQEYIQRSHNEDVEMIDVEEDDDEDEEDVESELEAESDEEEEGEDDERSDDEFNQESWEKNSQLVVGYKDHRTFVARGNKIGVFRPTEEGAVEYTGTIRNPGFKGSGAFNPKQLMLHDQDSKLIMMNPTDPHSLYNMDIESGKVVEKWKMHDDIVVDYIAPKSKFSQMTAEQTLVGTSHNALFRIDPRVSESAIVDCKQYTTKNKFSGVTTTSSGKLAVASEKGDIRLFDSVGKIAKTALPAMGDPILGIDVTADGRWIVATCKSYLLLIDTLIGQGKYAGALGFDRSFPADAKPQPRRLQLRAEHVVYMGEDISFSPSRFNIGQGQEENAIVTSTSRYVIAWDFKKVKKGKLDSYVIKKYEDDVVQDSFRFGDDQEIVVALSNDVLLVHKKQMKKLPQANLQTPVEKLKSRSSIVNSPY